MLQRLSSFAMAFGSLKCVQFNEQAGEYSC
jgi:hypothetical protein